MKRKLMICAMALCICAGLTGNTGEVSVWASEGSSSDAVRIGALKGPTAMGMAQLLDEDGYDFTIAASPDEIVPMVVQDKLDIAAVPANLAATLYQKTDKDVSVLAVNTLGVLYLVENGDSVKSVEDLKGKTIYASGKGATPEYALNSVLKANGIDPEKDVTVEFKSEHAEVVSALVQDQTAVGLLPQPFVTTALMKNDKLKVALDLNKLWEDSMDDGSKLVTGVVIANNEFVQDHADKVNDFMDAYKASVDFVNSDTEAAAQIIGDHDIIAKEVAQKAIPDCSIVFIEGDEMKTMLSGYLATLDDQNPEIIGGQYKHQKLVMELSAIIRNYIKQHKGTCEVLPAPFAVYLDEINNTYVEPDISVICDPNKLDDKGCKGAPDWIIEIVSPASRKMDYLLKLFKYRSAGVREYWIVDIAKNRITVYNFNHDYSIEEYSFTDTVKAGIYEDLSIDFSEINIL